MTAGGRGIVPRPNFCKGGSVHLRGDPRLILGPILGPRFDARVIIDI